MTISRTTRKQKRAALILAGLAILGIALGLVLYALNDTIVSEPVSTTNAARLSEEVRLRRVRSESVSIKTPT